MASDDGAPPVGIGSIADCFPISSNPPLLQLRKSAQDSINVASLASFGDEGKSLEESLARVDHCVRQGLWNAVKGEVEKERLIRQFCNSPVQERAKRQLVSPSLELEQELLGGEYSEPGSGDDDSPKLPPAKRSKGRKFNKAEREGICCKIPGCRKVAKYCVGDNGLPQLCVTHKDEQGFVEREDSESEVLRSCVFPHCERLPTHGEPGKKARFCEMHQLPGTVLAETCEEEHCLNYPRWGLEGQGAKLCGLHRTTDMVDEKRAKCSAANCSRTPGPATPGEKPIFCPLHKEAADDAESVARVRRCEARGCDRDPRFGFYGERPRVCLVHKVPNMVNSVGRMCEDSSRCVNEPSYGYLGDNPRYCTEHKVEGMIYLKRHNCLSAQCNSQPSYGELPGRPLYCAKHRTKGMRNVVAAKCDILGCSKAPRFNQAGLTARFCAEHKMDDMCDVKRRTCAVEACQKEPSYGYDGEKARFCNLHKDENMVFSNRKRCIVEGCTKGCYFGHRGQKPQHCAAHKKEGMIDLINMGRFPCQTQPCPRQAYYNNPGERVAKYCNTHREPQMVNVRHRLCEHELCYTTPTYSYAGERPRYCANHKLVDMVDTKTLTCEQAGCHKSRLYGFKGAKARFCSKHKLEGMINVKVKRCREGSCAKVAAYGFPGQKPTVCLAHKQPHMAEGKC